MNSTMQHRMDRHFWIADPPDAMREAFQVQPRISIPCHCHLVSLSWLTAKRLFEYSQMRFDIAFDVAALEDVFTVAPEEVVDCLDTNADRAGGLVFVEILE